MIDLSLLLKPQEKHALKGLNSLLLNGAFADLSSTGTGKTYVASWIASQLNVPVVIVCPKIVRRSWETVLNTFGVKAHVIINYEKLMRGNTQYLSFKDGKDEDHTFYDIKFPQESLVILDECHKCKGWNSKNSDFLIACKSLGYKLLLLSATAATNPLEMRSFGFATYLHNLKNFYGFMRDAGAYKGFYGGYQIDLASPETQTAMKYIHNTLFNELKIAGRMTVGQFGDIFSDNHIMAECYDMGSNTAKIEKVYLDMERDLAKLEESSKNYSQHHFAIMTKARRMAELLKIPAIVEMVEDMFDEGISPIIFLNYTDSVVALKAKLIKNKKYADKIGLIVGGQSDKARNASMEAFQADTLRIMIVNIAAGGMGVNLHDTHGNFHRHTILCPSWSAINMLQSLGRAHRANGKTPVQQRIFFAADTIEENICARVKARLTNLDLLNDGDLDLSAKLKF